MKKSKQIEKDNFANETSVDQALRAYAEFSLYAKGRLLQSYASNGGWNRKACLEFRRNS